MNRIATYFELTKPRLTSLALISTGVGFVMAAPHPLDAPRLIATLIGGALVGGGGNALNEWMEADVDALMRRTRARPLPTKRLSRAAASRFGFACVALGVAALALWSGWLAALLGLSTAVTYVALYTPLKRVTTLCTLVGAIPGALPPLIGWAAARGSLSLEAWVLFAIVFLWQLPHFLAIAWVYRDDYAAAGFRMLPVTDPEGFTTGRQMVLYGLALLPTSLLLTPLGLTGPWYFAGATLVGGWFLWRAALAARTPSPVMARQLFHASIGYLPLVLLLMLVDRIPL